MKFNVTIENPYNIRMQKMEMEDCPASHATIIPSQILEASPSYRKTVLTDLGQEPKWMDLIISQKHSTMVSSLGWFQQNVEYRQLLSSYSVGTQ